MKIKQTCIFEVQGADISRLVIADSIEDAIEIAKDWSLSHKQSQEIGSVQIQNSRVLMRVDKE